MSFNNYPRLNSAIIEEAEQYIEQNHEKQTSFEKDQQTVFPINGVS